MNMSPIGWVTSSRTEAIDDDWDAVAASITLSDASSRESLQGLADFSHLEVVNVFDQVDPAAIQTGVRHPRSNPEWPEVGIFAQRAKMRPNRIGVTNCTLLGVAGRTVTVRGLDAIDGSPVLDLKPHLREFGPRGAVHQPASASELMTGYWS